MAAVLCVPVRSATSGVTIVHHKLLYGFAMAITCRDQIDNRFTDKSTTTAESLFEGELHRIDSGPGLDFVRFHDVRLPRSDLPSRDWTLSVLFGAR